MKTAIKILRVPFQVIALIIQSYFIIETIRLYTVGYVVFNGNAVGNPWFSLLFTLLIVIACEVVSFIEVVLFVISKHNMYSFINLALFILNAILFMTVIYYYAVGTVIGLSLYASIYILRIVNLVLNVIDIFKKKSVYEPSLDAS